MLQRHFKQLTYWMVFSLVVDFGLAVQNSANAQGRGLFGGGGNRASRGERNVDRSSPRANAPASRSLVPPQSTPQVIAESPVVPAAFNQPAEEELLDAPPNPIPANVVVADAALARELGTELDAYLLDMTQQLAESVNVAVLTDDAREAFCAQYLTAEMDANLKTEMRNALIDYDAENAERIAKRLRLPQRAVDEIIPRARLSAILYDLRKLVRNEDSVEKIDAFSRRMQGAVRDFDLSRGERDAAAAKAESILDVLRVRLALTEKSTQPPGAIVRAPAGVLPAIGYPPLAPPGRVYLLGDRILAVGADKPGKIEVVRASAIDVCGMPRFNGTVAAETTSEAAMKSPTSGTVVFNPPELDRDISYTINGRAYTIRPGQSQELPAGTSWIIAFDGGGPTKTEYTLGEACYVFGEKDGKLTLLSRPCSVEIKNPVPLGAFSMVVDNKLVEIAAGETITLKSKYPIVAWFDRGTNGDVVYKKLWHGTYAIALQGDGELWELFSIPAADMQNDAAPIKQESDSK
jgi:hypothetical protein